MRNIRGLGLAVVAALAVTGVVLFGEGSPAQDTRLLSGAAWLASGKVGQVTLLDGMTAEVSAQVQVAPSGNSLAVVQQGTTAYAVDRSAGTIRRIDGATFDVSQPETPIADASRDLTVIPGRTALYTVDNRRGILADTDPRTLQRRGEMISVADKLTAGTAAVDDEGVFWSIDPATGKVARVHDGQRSLHDVAEPGESLITLANGHPVVIDRKGARAISLSSTTASVVDTIQLDVRPDDVLRASGSPHNERLYVVHKRGVLTVCDLLESDCSKVVPLAGDSDFGAPVESDNRLFVPNYATGEVWIIDLQRSAVLAKPKVLDTGSTFQLLTKDSVVFYNDLMSEKAGVIQLDGTVTPTAKYDPKNPARGVTTPVTGGPGTQQPTKPATAKPGTDKPTPSRQTDQPGQRTGADKPKSQLKISMSDVSPIVGQPIELRVQSLSGDQPTEAQWMFGDGASGDGATTSHKWAAANTYQVAVKARIGTEEVATSVPVTVSATPTYKVRVRTPDGGKITGNGIDCPGTCEVDLPPDTGIKLVATPSQGRTHGSWQNCPGSTTSCEFVLTGDRLNIGYTFGTAADPVTVRVTQNADGIVEGSGITCPSTCEVQVPRNTEISLSARAADPDRHAFDKWGGACTGAVQPCKVKASANVTTVQTTWKRKPIKLTITCTKIYDADGTISVSNGSKCVTAGRASTSIVVTGKPGDSFDLVATEDAPKRDGYTSHFDKYGGTGGCRTDGTKTCQVTLKDTDTEVTVTGHFRGLKKN
ncbi:PKD domain-containing protein [Kibdelosporangium philippinense]|uniref:PKD domain-containing protein n=1 Tax=Kibdelosporangium philippinense TaxID=211113 RepID=A0ABS8ZFS7_9PSEU|nr:PKD domain-containing protein [Kibdelosporangium philippinense]MCE7005770.1 PKD domain-containing protein [Kibdelosporangium philippinense]